MANRKSSITAQLELKGQNQFKSGLKDIGAAAQRAGKDVQKVRPPDVSLTPNYQYWKARERGEKMMTSMLKAEADKRVKLEQDAASRITRINHAGGGRWGHLQGTQFGGRKAGQGAGTGAASGGGKSRFGGDVNTAYQVAQDLAQGGPAAIANQVPQIVDMVMRNPMLKVIRVAGIAAAATAAAGYLGYDLYQNTGDRADKKGFDRYAINSAKSRQKGRAMEFDADKTAAATEGSAAGNSMVRADSVSAAGFANTQKRQQIAQAEIDIQRRIRMVRNEAIEDSAEKAKAAHEEEKQAIAEQYAAELNLAQDTRAWAADQYDIAGRRERQINDQLRAMKGQSLRPEQVIEKTRLEAELPAVKAVAESAKERRDAAHEEYVIAKDRFKLLESEKRLLDENFKKQQEAAQLDRERAIMNEVRAATSDRLTLRRMQREIDQENADKEKRRQKTRDEVSGQESLSGLSPRRRAKAEEEMQKKSRIESLKAEGFDGKEAEDIASREAKMASRSQVDADRASRGLRPRIRTVTDKGETARNRFNRMSSGDRKKLEGLSGSEDAATTYMRKQRGGLDAFGGDDAMSDRPRESNLPKRIKGAGSKREPEKDNKTIGGAVNDGWQAVVKAIETLRGAVERGNKPDGKPISVR